MSASPHPALRAWAAPALALALVVAALGLWAALPLDVLAQLLDETGPVERGTAWLYFITAAMWGVLAWRSPAGTRATVFAIALVLAAFGARELDLHKAWTGASVLKVSFYFGPAAWEYKALALAVLGPVGLATLYLVRRHAAAVVAGIGRGRPVAVTVLVFVLSIVVSKLVDRSQNVLLEDFGVAFPLWLSVLRAAVEEMLELGLAILPWIGWWQWKGEHEASGGR